MILSQLFPHLRTFEIRRVVTLPNVMRIEAWSRRRSAVCPTCAQSSQRLHSWYERHLHEQPCVGRSVELIVHVHRFCCTNQGCKQRTFVESLQGLAHRFARRTIGQEQALLDIGQVAGGQAGAQLARQQGLRGASASTLLRLIKRAKQRSAQEVRVVGLDDWAWRRGQRYGTILVDLQRQRPIDLLEEYSVEAIAAWLRQHPRIEVVVRDRSKVGIQAIHKGAPQAVQVADRFHLLRNLCDALAEGFAKHPPPRDRWEEAKGDLPPQEPQAAAKSPEQAQCFEQMQRLRAAGWSYRAIERVVGVSYKTVERWLKRGSAPLPGQVVLRERASGRAARAAKPRLVPKQAAILFIRDPDDLPAKQREQLRELLSSRADVQPIYELARAFVRLVQAKESQALAPWLECASQAAWSELRSFAQGLREDQAAVEAALRLPYSNGPVEGHNTRLKLLKRQMYGRAKLPLLRARVLA